MSDVTQLALIMNQQAAVMERILLSVRSLELLVAAGESPFLVAAADETEQLLDDLATLDAARAMATDLVAGGLGLIGAEPSLDEIIAALPEAEAAVLSRLGGQLRAQAEEFAAVGTGGAAATQAALRLQHIEAAMDHLEGGAAFADSYGDATPLPPVPALRFNVGA